MDDFFANKPEKPFYSFGALFYSQTTLNAEFGRINFLNRKTLNTGSWSCTHEVRIVTPPRQIFAMNVGPSTHMRLDISHEDLYNINSLLAGYTWL
jgi:hypothetical protein